MSEENEVIRAMIDSVNRGNLSRSAHDHELGSMTRRLLAAVARELSALADQLRAFYDSAFIESAAPRRWLLPLLPAAVVVAVAITWRRCKRRERDWNARTPDRSLA